MKTRSEISAERVAWTMRNRFNPIRGLSPQVLVQQLEQFRTGDFRALALTWDAMERRDLMIAGVAGKRKKDVARLPWEIEAEEESPEAEAHREFLEGFYNRLRCVNAVEPNERGGVRLLLKTMAGAIGQRWSCHEVVFRPKARTGLSVELRWCPLWFFEGRTGPLRFLEQEYALDGVEMRAGEWLVTAGEGLMEATSVAYIFKSLPIRDALALCEKFGMPGIVAKTSAPRGSEEWEALKTAVAGYGQDFGMVTSEGEQITTIPAGMTGQAPQLPLVEYWDRQIASLWRGADLSTISSGAGTQGTGASLQGEEKLVLLDDDATGLAETLNEQLDRLAIKYQFGEEVEPKAWFKLRVPKAQDALEEFKRRVWLGFQADGTVSDVLANSVSLRTLTGEVGLPVEETYTEPWLPVKDDTGAMVTGEVVKDSEGDIVGGLAGAAHSSIGEQRAGSPPRLEDTKGEVPGVAPGTAPEAGALPEGEGKEGEMEAAMGNETGMEGRRAVAPPMEEVLRAMAADLAPVRERLERIMGIEDPEIFKAKMAALAAELPGLARDIGQDPAAAAAMGREMAVAFQAGAQARKEAKK